MLLLTITLEFVDDNDTAVQQLWSVPNCACEVSAVYRGDKDEHPQQRAL